MADLTEDSIPSHSPATIEDEDDDDGLAPDFRFLGTLATPSSLPRRGTKDFEPHPTARQASVLSSSRAAMGLALSHVRTHAPKNHVLGTWDAVTQRVLVPKPRGTQFQSMGASAGGAGVLLRTEEALYLVERGSLDVWSEGAPMSLQGAYAALLGAHDALSAEQYMVYAGLRRAGFVVFRAGKAHAKSEVVGATAVDGGSGWGSLYALLARRPEAVGVRARRGPLVPQGLYRSYAEVYALLQLPRVDVEPRDMQRDGCQDNTVDQETRRDSRANQDGHSEDGDSASPYTTTFDVFHNTPSFRKSAPGVPAFRVCVLGARNAGVPSLAQLDGLLDEQTYTPNSVRGRGGGMGGVYKRLKEGQRNVLLAVVDGATVSYMRIAESDFTREKVYEVGHGRGGKGGGRGRGRGRGRGTGRGG